MPDYFDIHTHVNFKAFENDAEAVISSALKEGVWLTQVGTQKNTSKSAVMCAEKYKEGVYATVGLHPIHTSASFHDIKELGEDGKEFTSCGEIFDDAYYKALAVHPKVVAIGECGLDYFRLSEESKEKQKNAFVSQIHLANEIGKPLMLHIRNAYKDAYEILKSEARVYGNVHFFAGTWEEAKYFLDMGFTISFTGVITFTNDYDDVVKNAPLDMIMSETDAPYVAPVPHRGKRNEPIFVKDTVKRIAEIRQEDFEKVRKTLVSNAFRVFHDVVKA